MIDGHRVIVVMPMYNEAPHVADALGTVPALVDDIVVVDDGSSDGSADAVRGAGDPRVCLISHIRRGGVGRALRTGLRAALSLSPDLIATMDSDGQMWPEDLPRLLAPLTRGEATYVKGDRFAPEISRRDMPAHRRLVNRVSSAYFSRVLGDGRLRDVQCGYTAMTSATARMLVGRGFHPSYGVYNDMLSRVLAMPGSRVEYVPVAAIYGVEDSHLRFRDVLRLGALTLRITLRRGRLLKSRTEAGRVGPVEAGRLGRGAASQRAA